MKRHLLTLIKVGASVAIIVYLFNSQLRGEQLDQFIDTPKHWGWIGAGFLACLTAHLVGFVRWQLLVRALGMPFSTFDAIRIGFIGTLFNFVAFGPVGGDTLRAFYVTRQAKDRVAEAVSSVVADRVIGLLTMFTTASVAYLCLDTSALASEHPDEYLAIAYVCKFVVAMTAVGIASMIALFCVPQLIESRLYQTMLQVPKLGVIVSRMTGIVSIYRTKLDRIALAFLMSFGVNVFFIISIYSLAVGLTPSFPSFGNHFVIEPIAMVSNAAPLPGGIGGMELAMKFLYLAFACETGVIVAFAFRFALLAVAAIGTGFWLASRSQIDNVMAKNATT